MPRYYTRYEMVALVERLMIGRTQRDVAKSMGVSQALVSKALSGGNPGVLCRIYEHLAIGKVERDYFKVN